MEWNQLQNTASFERVPEVAGTVADVKLAQEHDMVIEVNPSTPISLMSMNYRTPVWGDVMNAAPALLSPEELAFAAPVPREDAIAGQDIVNAVDLPERLDLLSLARNARA
jgi:hypothetical protein